jgi:uncharacterized protein YggE
MKKLILLAASAVFINATWSQQPVAAVNPFPKTITVSGSAEMEIVPDEIYVNITLREYQKKGDNKKELETIKTQFLESCRAVNIPDSAIGIASFTGYNNYVNFRKRKKDPNLMASITFQVKFKDSKAMDALVEKLDDEATQSFIIANTSHSKMTEFRKQLKIQAVKAAKEKGIYLTEAIGEKLGSAITITEPDEPGSQSYRSNALVSNISSQYMMNYKDKEITQEIDFKKIKLRFEVAVIFALQ